MGSASIDILFDKIDHEAAQFLQERTRVAMRLFVKEMDSGLSVTKAAKKLGVAGFHVVGFFGRFVWGAFSSSFRDPHSAAHACCLRRRTQPGGDQKGVPLVVARPRIMPVMGRVGALFGADMLASAEGSKPNRVVGDIGGMRHSTGRWPSSRRESRSRSTFWAGASMCSSGLRLPSAGRCGRHRLCVVRQGAGRFCRPGRCLRARCHSSLPPSSSS